MSFNLQIEYIFYLQTPGRLTHMLGQGDASMNQEYVIFDSNQVLPLCLLTYETS